MGGRAVEESPDYSGGTGCGFAPHQSGVVRARPYPPHWGFGVGRLSSPNSRNGPAFGGPGACGDVMAASVRTSAKRRACLTRMLMGAALVVLGALVAAPALAVN